MKPRTHQRPRITRTLTRETVEREARQLLAQVQRGDVDARRLDGLDPIAAKARQLRQERP